MAMSMTRARFIIVLLNLHHDHLSIVCGINCGKPTGTLLGKYFQADSAADDRLGGSDPVGAFVTEANAWGERIVIQWYTSIPQGTRDVETKNARLAPGSCMVSSCGSIPRCSASISCRSKIFFGDILTSMLALEPRDKFIHPR